MKPQRKAAFEDLRVRTFLGVERRALYSRCGMCAAAPRPLHLCPDPAYRYLLEIIWDPSIGPAMFIGLNPSTATEWTNDPTVERCERFARGWNCGGLLMTNLFAFRATDPKVMKAAEDPAGPENTVKFLQEQAARSKYVIAAWGNLGDFHGRASEVRSAIGGLQCLRVNSNGSPSHPLYLPGALRPIRYD